MFDICSRAQGGTRRHPSDAWGKTDYRRYRRYCPYCHSVMVASALPANALSPTCARPLRRQKTSFPVSENSTRVKASKNQSMPTGLSRFAATSAALATADWRSPSEADKRSRVDAQRHCVTGDVQHLRRE